MAKGVNQQESINTFSEGLNTDLNPLLTPNNTLTDCVNGSILTYNGNELILQNDQGNYKLKNAKLSDNFVPIGIKEHADIVYIVSYNPLTDETEIGSYPSPQTIFSTDDKDIGVEIVSLIPTVKNEYKYTDLIKNSKLYLYADTTKVDDYFINNGDEFKLTKSTNNIYEKTDFYILDSDKKLNNISDIITAEYLNQSKFKNVPWKIPGWLVAKNRLPIIDSCNIEIDNLNAPNPLPDGIQFEIKCSIKVNVTTSDKLLLNELKDKPIHFKIETFKNNNLISISTLSSNHILLNSEIGTYNGIITDTTIPNLNSHDEIEIKCTPYISHNGITIMYDNMITSAIIDWSANSSANSIKVAEDIFKTYVNDNKTSKVEFSITGSPVDENTLSVTYNLIEVSKFINGDFTSYDNGPVEDLKLQGKSNIINFTTKVEVENLYILELLFYVDKKIIKKSQILLVLSKLLNKFYTSKLNFNRDIYLHEWFNDYDLHHCVDNYKFEFNTNDFIYTEQNYNNLTYARPTVNIPGWVWNGTYNTARDVKYVDDKAWIFDYINFEHRETISKSRNIINNTTFLTGKMWDAVDEYKLSYNLNNNNYIFTLDFTKDFTLTIHYNSLNLSSSVSSNQYTKNKYDIINIPSDWLESFITELEVKDTQANTPTYYRWLTTEHAMGSDNVVALPGKIELTDHNNVKWEATSSSGSIRIPLFRTLHGKIILPIFGGVNGSSSLIIQQYGTDVGTVISSFKANVRYVSSLKTSIRFKFNIGENVILNEGNLYKKISNIKITLTKQLSIDYNNIISKLNTIKYLNIINNGGENIQTKITKIKNFNDIDLDVSNLYTSAISLKEALERQIAAFNNSANTIYINETIIRNVNTFIIDPNGDKDKIYTEDRINFLNNLLIVKDNLLYIDSNKFINNPNLVNKVYYTWQSLVKPTRFTSNEITINEQSVKMIVDLEYQFKWGGYDAK